MTDSVGRQGGREGGREEGKEGGRMILTLIYVDHGYTCLMVEKYKCKPLIACLCLKMMYTNMY